MLTTAANASAWPKKRSSQPPIGPTATPGATNWKKKATSPDSSSPTMPQSLVASGCSRNGPAATPRPSRRNSLTAYGCRSIDSLPDIPSASVSTKPVASAEGRNSGKRSPRRDEGTMNVSSFDEPTVIGCGVVKTRSSSGSPCHTSTTRSGRDPEFIAIVSVSHLVGGALQFRKEAALVGRCRIELRLHAVQEVEQLRRLQLAVDVEAAEGVLLGFLAGLRVDLGWTPVVCRRLWSAPWTCRRRPFRAAPAQVSP